MGEASGGASERGVEANREPEGEGEHGRRGGNWRELDRRCRAPRRKGLKGGRADARRGPGRNRYHFSPRGGGEKRRRNNWNRGQDICPCVGLIRPASSARAQDSILKSTTFLKVPFANCKIGGERLMVACYSASSSNLYPRQNAACLT